MKKSETEEKQRKKFKLEVYWSCFGYATALINNASKKKKTFSEQEEIPHSRIRLTKGLPATKHQKFCVKLGYKSLYKAAYFLFF